MAEGAARTATSAAAERANGILERFCFFRVIRVIFRAGAVVSFIEVRLEFILSIGGEGLGLTVVTAEAVLRKIFEPNEGVSTERFSQRVTLHQEINLA